MSPVSQAKKPKPTPHKSSRLHYLAAGLIIVLLAFKYALNANFDSSIFGLDNFDLIFTLLLSGFGLFLALSSVLPVDDEGKPAISRRQLWNHLAIFLGIVFTAAACLVLMITILHLGVE